MSKRLELKSLTKPKMSRAEAYEHVEALFREAQRNVAALDVNATYDAKYDAKLQRDQLQRLLMYFAPAVPAKAKDKFSYLARFVAVKDVRYFLQYIFVNDGIAYASDGHIAARVEIDLPDGWYEPKTGARIEDSEIGTMRYPWESMNRIIDDARKIKDPDSFKLYEGIGKSEVSKAGAMYGFQGFDEKYGFDCKLLDRAANKEPLTIYTSEKYAVCAAIVEGPGVLADDVVVMPLKF